MMADGKMKMQKINHLYSSSSITRSNSFGAWKKKQFKNKLRNDFYFKMSKCIQNYGCGFTIDKIISKLGYKPYIFNEVENYNEDSYLIKYTDDIIHNIYDSNDVFDFNIDKTMCYNLDPENYIGYNNKVHHYGSENNIIKENILSLENFILNVKKYHEEYLNDINYKIIAREDLNALVMYLEVNYNIYEYIFKREKKNKFLKEIVEFCWDNSIIPFH